MSIGLEHVFTGDGIQRNFERLNSLVLDTGGVSAGIRMGSGTLTFPGGSPNTTTLNVAHGLGKTPAGVWFTMIAASGPIAVFSTAVTATTFGVRGRTFDGSSPAAAVSQNFYWLAVG